MRNGSLGWAGRWLVCLVALGLLTSCGFRRKKYENPITKDTLQPDKILFDKAIQDIEKGRYEVARLTLQTLISTYDTSEFLAKAKLALADSWFREGGSHGLAQAEAEYKDFILFYPTLEEAAEAQHKVCMIHYRQMEKPDRDPLHALRAEDECRQLIVQFPNSKFVPEAQQRLREIQEVLAEHEYRVGSFYHTKGSYIPAANRLQGLTDHYRLYSKADQALWKLGDSYEKLGPRFRDRSAAAYARIVRDYPLSPLVEEARKKLERMEQPIPEPDPVALARMKYELENYRKPGLMSHFWGIFRKSPDVRAAAKSGEPAMTTLRPTLPVSVPAAAEGGGVSAEVTVSTISDSSALDTKPDARRNPPQAESAPQTQGQGQSAPEPKDQKKNNGRNNKKSPGK
ncbi:MAG: outer membrane protein assembly factor BamD [Bryobacteraceae bacterium]|jgi:outer membrane protein assembly factor BamD|nr:outer membrane protein assembly factor BamD [Bryobacteraceae bacterium]